MDRKITELDSIEQLKGDEYLVIASEYHNENYKVKVSDFIDQQNLITVDEELSLVSTNPVQNKVITTKINEINDKIDNFTGGDSIGFDLSVASVETQTLAPDQNANVEIVDLGTTPENVKSLAFKFRIPRGKDGRPGEGGSGSGSFGYRTVFAFIHSIERPEKPEGGSWDAVTNEITYPEGWSGSDDLERPVYMSNATFDQEGIVTDWSEPIMISGTDGEGGGGDGSDSKALEFIYNRSDTEENEPKKPQNNSYVDDYVPRDEGWEDHPLGVNEKLQCEWVCTRSYNELFSSWNDWEGPALWAKYGANGKDGDGVEYIYQLTSKYDNKPAVPGKTPAENSPTQNFQDREFIPKKASGDENPWTDNPSDVSISLPYEWVSVRKFKWDTQTWGDFEEPTLWAKYGKDGDEAVAAFKSIVFTRSNTTPGYPEGGTYANPVPDSPVDQYGNPIWSDGIPDGEQIVWSSSRIFTADGEHPQQASWTAPRQMTDTASFDVEFSSYSNPGAPVGHPNTNPQWSNASDSSTIWMATSTMANGIWSDWQISKIKGEAGEAGTSINILGSFDSYEALLNAYANNTLPGNNPPITGDCYMVNGVLYIWDGDSWFNAGSIKGTPGVGIKTITCEYQLHTDGTSIPTGTWLPNSPATDNINKYLWKKTTITYSNVENEAIDDTTFYELIGVHGDKGIDGDSVEYIFCLTKNDVAPTKPSSNNPINSNSTKGQWSDDALGTDSEWKYEWVSMHVKTWDESKQLMVWGPYNDPVHWSVFAEDGRSISSILAEYTVHSYGSDTPTNLSKLTWTTSSPAATTAKPYLWKRSKVSFTDGTTSDAWQYEMIGKLGDRGIDGNGVEYAFKLTTDRTAPSDKPSGDVTSNTAGQWTDEPLTMMEYNGVSYKYQWVSQRSKKDGEWGEYSTPSLWSELYPGTYLHIKYSNDIENKKFTSNNGEDVGKYIGVLTDYHLGDSGDFDDYTWRKFEGDDGFGREYIFKLGNDFSNPPSVPTETSNSPQFQPTSWSLNPLIPNNDTKYCWCCHRDYRNNVWGSWTGNSINPNKAYLFSMFAESVKGSTGNPGPILYPAGYWESSKKYSQTLDGEVVKATPYVYDTQTAKYYYLTSKTVTSTTRPSSDNTNWQLMDTYTAIYTDILLANNAKVGQAVFNGDFMFSQNGIDASGNAVSGTEYIEFNASDPYKESNKFRPTWCVNLKTGQQWMGNGTCTFRANGSGYVANGAIAWDANGVVTHFPKTNVGTGTITAKSATPYTMVNVSVILSGEWENIDDVEVELIDDIENFSVSAFPNVTLDQATNITIKHPESTVALQKQFKDTCVARLYVNGKVIAESPVIITGKYDLPVIPDGYDTYDLTLTANGATNLYLHNSASRSISGTINGFFAIAEDADGKFNTSWDTQNGLLVNGNTTGSTSKLFAGDTVYVYLDNETQYKKSFTLKAENQEVFIQ